MFDDELHPIVFAAEKQVGVRPRPEVSAATQSQPAGDSVAAGLARVVDDEDGDSVLGLQCAEVAEDGRDFVRGVFISCDHGRYVTLGPQAAFPRGFGANR